MIEHGPLRRLNIRAIRWLKANRVLFEKPSKRPKLVKPEDIDRAVLKLEKLLVVD